MAEQTELIIRAPSSGGCKHVTPQQADAGLESQSADLMSEHHSAGGESRIAREEQHPAPGPERIAAQMLKMTLCVCVCVCV